MKVEIEVDDDFIDETVRQSLKWRYEHMVEDPLDKEYQRKLKKALKKVHNFYASPSEQIE